MIFSSLLSDSRLIFSSKLMIFCLENHDSFEIENFYHLLCAFSFYFSTSALRKSLSFTMCFLILFLDFLWKHAWAQLSLTEKISIIYYVLSHRVFRRAHCHWENLYYLICAFSFYSSTSILKTSLLFTMCFLIESCSSTSALSLRKSLLFSECFLSYWCSRLDINSDHDRCQVIFWDIEKISII